MNVLDEFSGEQTTIIEFCHLFIYYHLCIFYLNVGAN